MIIIINIKTLFNFEMYTKFNNNNFIKCNLSIRQITLLWIHSHFPHCHVWPFVCGRVPLQSNYYTWRSSVTPQQQSTMRLLWTLKRRPDDRVWLRRSTESSMWNWVVFVHSRFLLEFIIPFVLRRRLVRKFKFTDQHTVQQEALARRRTPYRVWGLQFADLGPDQNSQGKRRGVIEMAIKFVDPK